MVANKEGSNPGKDDSFAVLLCKWPHHGTKSSTLNVQCCGSLRYATA